VGDSRLIMLFGDRGLRWIRLGLCALLFLIGAGFVWQGARGPSAVAG
jgi:hypothetical protein